MQADVLIVGGGLSGLALADHLAQQGTDFLLVEAQDRFGGRIRTKDVAGGQFDLGPAWFWPGQPRMAAMTERFEIPVFEQFSQGTMVFQDRTGGIQRGMGYASMQGSYRLAGGMGALIDALVAGQTPERLMTGTKLQKIERVPDGIIAHLFREGSELTIMANRIVMALPPRVIGDTILFDPPLDADTVVTLKKIPTWMAGQAKIVAVYDTPHWRNTGLSGDGMSHRGPMVELHDASPIEGGPFALFGFVGIPADVRTGREDELLDAARAQLVAMFGAEMANPFDLILQDWATIPEIARPDDRTAGGHHPIYGLPSKLRDLAGKEIYFGGTETAQGFGGFLEGALEAAERTAKMLGAASTP